MAKIEKQDNSIVIEYNAIRYVFPMNAVKLLAEKDSVAVNVMVGSRKNLISIPNSEIENHSATAVDTVNKLNNEIYN